MRSADVSRFPPHGRAQRPHEGLSANAGGKTRRRAGVLPANPPMAPAGRLGLTVHAFTVALEQPAPAPRRSPARPRSRDGGRPRRHRRRAAPSHRRRRRGELPEDEVSGVGPSASPAHRCRQFFFDGVPQLLSDSEDHPTHIVFHHPVVGRYQTTPSFALEPRFVPDNLTDHRDFMGKN